MGKSTVALRFTKNEYPDYIVVDFQKEVDLLFVGSEMDDHFAKQLEADKIRLR